MIRIGKSTRENPATFECCGKDVVMFLYWDYLEGRCPICGNTYAVKVAGNLCNCCMAPENFPLNANGKLVLQE